VFICITFVGVIWAYFVVPETKGVPLEELAAIFGDDDEIVVYMKDIHVDHKTHQLVVDKQKGTEELGKVVTELHGPTGTTAAPTQPEEATKDEGEPKDTGSESV
jgi:hypothetical protein